MKVFPKKVIITLLLMVGGWAIFMLIRLLLEKFLINIGIVDEIIQMSIIVFLVIGSLTLLGYGFKKSLKKLNLF